MEKRVNELWNSVGTNHWLVTGWHYALKEALAAMARPGVVAAIPFHPVGADLGAWEKWPSPAWCLLALDSFPGAALVAGCPQPTVAVLAKLVADVEELSEAECQETFLEVLNQTGSGVSGAISSRLKKRVGFAPAKVCEMPAALDYAIQIEFPFGGATHPMALVPTQAMLEAMGGLGGQQRAVQEPAAAVSPVSSAAAASPNVGNLELLLEVELPVSVTFGRTQLLLKDVLKLSSGSIVELNRQVHEPVEVVINNCVVARGEVVVVEGNYGIRVTEIVSRHERIRSIL